MQSKRGDLRSGLIEAYWNVNWDVEIERVTPSLGLIEAYWNVNIQEIIQQNRKERGLIEAYWNVNEPNKQEGRYHLGV